MSSDSSKKGTGNVSEGDVDLIRRALGGDKVATRAFFERMRCVPRIVSAINARLGRRLGPDECEDVVQESLMAVWKKLEQYDGRAKLETWIYPFCYFETLRRLRKKRRDPVLLDETLEASYEPHTETLPDLEIQEQVLVEIDKLEPDVAIILRLKLFEDLTFDAISERLSISSNTIKSRYYRGVRKLSRALEKTTGRSAQGGAS